MENFAKTRAELLACRLCEGRFAATASGHVPRPIVHLHPRARIGIASQAPGARAHASGIPFRDPSGVRLRDWMGLDEETFFAPGTLAIVPMGFCFPGHDAAGGDLPPPAICRRTWHDRVMSVLPELRLVLVIGGLAQRRMLGTTRMTEAVRDWQGFGKCVPLPHPSWRNTPWLKRNPWFEAEVLPDLRARVRDALA
ncbi:uracil-DNA glycosylase family protein [Roseobacter sp. HKCCA0434]|uniref:uracil-DNA glycosylase family protein n=1 Tax=Roseobacter sp. HKCCA0434 TaxID=3079297 RepID=UPI002905F691|nr:uracil-DNA glycosylase family protein [Roseobacter sp. HKCCA0434]